MHKVILLSESYAAARADEALEGSPPVCLIAAKICKVAPILLDVQVGPLHRRSQGLRPDHRALLVPCSLHSAKRTQITATLLNVKPPASACMRSCQQQVSVDTGSASEGARKIGPHLPDVGGPPDVWADLADVEGPGRVEQRHVLEQHRGSPLQLALQCTPGLIRALQVSCCEQSSSSLPMLQFTHGQGLACNLIV